jgi:hypothetical protein
VDKEIDNCIKKRQEMYPGEPVYGLYMEDSDSGSIDRWHKFVKQQLRDTFKPLNEKLIF